MACPGLPPRVTTRFSWAEAHSLAALSISFALVALGWTGDLLRPFWWCIFHPAHRRVRHLVVSVCIFHTTVAMLDEPLQVGANHTRDKNNIKNNLNIFKKYFSLRQFSLCLILFFLLVFSMMKKLRLLPETDNEDKLCLFLLRDIPTKMNPCSAVHVITSGVILYDFRIWFSSLVIVFFFDIPFRRMFTRAERQR
jgi:hypothetical protein